MIIYLHCEAWQQIEFNDTLLGLSYLLIYQQMY